MEIFAGVIGVLTLIVGVGVKLIGFPDQIRQNARRRSTEGLSTTFMVMSFLAYVLWTLHGWLEHDMVVFVGQFAGVITSAIILWQIRVYGKEEQSARDAKGSKEKS